MCQVLLLLNCFQIPSRKKSVLLLTVLIDNQGVMPANYSMKFDLL